MTPTQRSLQKLREEGCCLVQVVERFIAQANVRQDLFGIIDIMAIHDTATVAVQTTSGNCIPDHLAKMLGSRALRILLDAGWDIRLHGWRKLKVKRGGRAYRYACRDIRFDAGPRGAVTHREL